MQFNEYWTKEVNDQYRQMIKEHKSMDDIKAFFGKDLMDKHPENKFATGSIIPILKRMKYFQEFTNEITINPQKIDYEYHFHSSDVYNYKTDYILYFTIGERDYVFLLYYYICKNVHSLNLLFTTKDLYKKYTIKKNEFLKNKNYGDFSEEEYNELVNIVEEETNFNEPIKIIKALSFILFDFYERVLKTRYLTIKFSITETRNTSKIKFYRNIIKSSFPGVKESEDIDDDGKKIYYYKIN